MNKLLRARIMQAAAVVAAMAFAPAAAEGPAMWRVSDADSDIYLFGTFHILPPTIAWTTPTLDEAMAKTPITMTEADTDSPESKQKVAALVQELGLNPPGLTLSSQLGPERSKQFAAVCERYGIPMAALEPMRPWLALLSLSVGAMQAEGFSPDAGAEQSILSKAAAQNDRIAHLETAEFQIRALAGLSTQEWLADFERNMAQIADLEGFTKRTVEAWRKGEVRIIEEEMLTPMRKSAPGAYKALIVDRNVDWTLQIEEIMKGSDDYFIAAGTGHFIGADGVVEMLQRKGYKVERVQ